MPGSLSTAGKAAVLAAAQKFLAQYKAALKAKGITLARQASKAEFYAVGFFKGKEKISNLVPTPFADANRGCKTATVTLHPHPDWKDKQQKSSQTLSNVPQALDDIRKKKIFPNEQFISGHMINANFGGDHTDPGNQTVLTVAANGQHDFDDAMKAAATRMGTAVWEMCRVSQAPNAATYLDSLYNTWTIKIDVTVSDDSWFDTYSADPVLQSDPTVTANKYPLNAVATEIVFTAQANGTPDENDIADNLKIHEGKMPSIARAIAEFKQFMDEAARFELRQPAPADFTRRSTVATTTSPLTGASVAKIAPGTGVPLQPKKKKGTGTTKPKKPMPIKVPCYLTYGTTRIRLQEGGDNEIGASTPNYPWASVKTSLKGDPIFYITAENSQAAGPAYVTRGDKVKAKIVVAGADLIGTARLPLADGETIQVYDDREPAQGYYELTFEQK